MAKLSKSADNAALLAAALEGLELQRQRIEVQIQQVRGMLGKRGGAALLSRNDNGAEAVAVNGSKRQLSDSARKRIAAAQKKRWAEYRRNAAQREKS